MKQKTDIELLQELWPTCQYSVQTIKLKYQLLAYGLVKPNRFLTKYLDLIEANLTMPKILFETQSHHCIPLGLYCDVFKLDFSADKIKARKLSELLISDNITINLKFKDHLLAHWYLYKCARSKKFKLDNLLACSYSINNFNKTKIKLNFKSWQITKLLKDPTFLDKLQLNYTTKLKLRSQKITKNKPKDN